MTLCPLLASAIGRLPTTSPSPPVLLHGATSEDTKMVSRGLSVCGADSLDSVGLIVFFTWTRKVHEHARHAVLKLNEQHCKAANVTESQVMGCMQVKPGAHVSAVCQA